MHDQWHGLGLCILNPASASQATSATWEAGWLTNGILISPRLSSRQSGLQIGQFVANTFYCFFILFFAKHIDHDHSRCWCCCCWWEGGWMWREAGSFEAPLMKLGQIKFLSSTGGLQVLCMSISGSHTHSTSHWWWTWRVEDGQQQSWPSWLRDDGQVFSLRPAAVARHWNHGEREREPGIISKN